MDRRTTLALAAVAALVLALTGGEILAHPVDNLGGASGRAARRIFRGRTGSD